MKRSTSHSFQNLSEHLNILFNYYMYVHPCYPETTNTTENIRYGENQYVTIVNKYLSRSGNNFLQIGMIHGKLFQNRHLNSLIIMSNIDFMGSVLLGVSGYS